MPALHPLLVSLSVLALAIGSHQLPLANHQPPVALQSSDLSRLRAVGQVVLSPDGRNVAYSVIMRDRPGRPYSQIWVMDVATRKSARLGDDKSAASSPRWSPDSRWLSYEGGDGQQSGLWITHPDGSDPTFLAPMQGSNSPLPGQGEAVSWSRTASRSRSSHRARVPKPPTRPAIPS